MPIQTAEAQWDGNFREGHGHITTGSGKLSADYDAPSRFEVGKNTNPEELIGAAHAGCFTMALVVGLDRAGSSAEHVRTTAQVSLEKDAQGFRIAYIQLHTEARVPNLDGDKFQRIAQDAKANCPVSRALSGVEIRLSANLVK